MFIIKSAKQLKGNENRFFSRTMVWTQIHTWFLSKFIWLLAHKFKKSLPSYKASYCQFDVA
jgi:hypothetical protein